MRFVIATKLRNGVPPHPFLGGSSFTGRWLVVAVTTWYARETTDGTNETALLELELKVRAGRKRRGWNLSGLSDWSDYFFEGSWNDRVGGDTDQWSQWPWCIACNCDLTIMCTGGNTFGGWILNTETNEKEVLVFCTKHRLCFLCSFWFLEFI